MTDISGLILAKQCLMNSLGDKFTTYLKALKQWFNLQSSKEDFDVELKKILSEDQMKIHNQLFTQLLKTCHDYTAAPTSPHASSEGEHSTKRSKLSSSSSKKKSRSHHVVQGNDSTKQCNTSLFRGDEPTPNRFSQQELVLPDESFLYMRMLHCAWEYELDAVEMTAAQLITEAVQNFLKNVLTAVLRQRSGFKVRDGNFIYAMGTPVENPWLRSVSRRRLQTDAAATANGVNRRHVVVDDDDCSGRLQAATANGVNGRNGMAEDDDCVQPGGSGRLSYSQLEQEVALSISTAKNAQPCAALTVQEVCDGLRVNRSVIQSHIMYNMCMERLFLSTTHPSWEEFGE